MRRLSIAGTYTQPKNCLYTIYLGHNYWLNSTIFIKIEFVNRKNPVISHIVSYNPSMISNVPLTLAILEEGMMARSICNDIIFRENQANAVEGALDELRHGIRHAVVGCTVPALAPHKVVYAVTLEHVGAFAESLVRTDVDWSRTVFEILNGMHILVQGCEIDPAAAPDEIDLAVIVEEDLLVHRVGAVDLCGDDGLVNEIDEWTAGRVCYGYTNAICAFRGDGVVGRVIEIEFAVLLDRAGCPEGISCPSRSVGGEDIVMLSPRHEVIALESCEGGLVIEIDG
jgi:hypothetical protein